MVRFQDLGPRDKKRLNSLEYGGGLLWVYHCRILAGGTQDHTFDMVPGTGVDFEFGWGMLQNGSTAAAHNGFVLILDQGGLAAGVARQLGNLLGFHSIPVGRRATFPERFTYGTGPQEEMGYGGQRLIIAGDMELHAELDGQTVNQDTEFALVGKVRGGHPAVKPGFSTGTATIDIRDEFYT